VGAAVLVAAAIILIPEMLSGPKDSAPAPTELPTQSSEANGVKTYTIDLNAAQRGQATQSNKQGTESVPAESSATVGTLAPPPETPSEATQDAHAPTQAPRAQQSTTSQATLERDQRLLDEFASQEKPVQKPEVKPAEKVANAVAPATAKTGTDTAAQSSGAGGWTVQVASFGVRATSERIAGELKAKGYPAFVTSYAGKGQTMYRVRVGPVADRAAAEQLLKKIKSLHPDANIAPP
jgi:DedD protein